MDHYAMLHTPRQPAPAPPVSRPFLASRPFFQDPVVSSPPARENAPSPQDWDDRLDRAARLGHRIEHLIRPEPPEGELVSRAFAGRLRPGEVRPQRVPRVDLTRGELSSLAAAANEVADPAATPVPDGLRKGTAVSAGGHIAVPGLPVGDGASGADLIEALGRTPVKDAALEVSGSRYTLKLRQNPWYDAVTGELLDPQPEEGGTHGQQRTFNSVAAVWRRPKRERQTRERFDFGRVREREQELRQQERERKESRRQERQERQQRQEQLASEGVQIDPEASWGLEQQITRAHRASRPEKRWNQAVSSMHVPLQSGGSFGKPIVSQQRSSKVSQNVLRRSLRGSGLQSPTFLPQPPSHQHAEPTGQLDFLFQMASALERGESPPLLALETSSRGRCDKCESNPETLGLQGLIVKDPSRRLYEDTPHWHLPEGFPGGFADEDWGSEDERALAESFGEEDSGSESSSRSQRKKKKRKKMRPVVKSEHPFSKDQGGPKPPPSGGGLGGMILVNN